MYRHSTGGPHHFLHVVCAVPPTSPALQSGKKPKFVVPLPPPPLRGKKEMTNLASPFPLFCLVLANRTYKLDRSGKQTVFLDPLTGSSAEHGGDDFLQKKPFE